MRELAIIANILGRIRAEKTHLTNTNTLRAECGLICEDAYSLFPHLHAVLTSSNYVDTFRPTCLASKAQTQDLVKV